MHIKTKTDTETHKQWEAYDNKSTMTEPSPDNEQHPKLPSVGLGGGGGVGVMHTGTKSSP